MSALRPSEFEVPVYYPNGDPKAGPGMDQGDYDHGEIGADDFRTVDELIATKTFGRLQDEFQRRYIAMCVAAKLEAGLILGVGTGWRDWDQQMANHLANPTQFAHPRYSLHMNRGIDDVAYAIDSVPYDALNWAHANCGRFGINYLDHIPNERHHCQPIELPNGGSQFTDDYAVAARARVDLPYLRTMSLAAWLLRDAPIHIDGRGENTPPDPDPVPPDPDPTPNPPARTLNPAQLEDPMLYIGLIGDVFWFGYPTQGANWATRDTANRLLASNKCFDLKTGKLLYGSSSGSVQQCSQDELTAVLGPDRFQHGRKL